MRRVPHLPVLLTAGVLGVALAVPAISVLPSWTGESDQATSNFGFSAAPAGDVNGDGYGDLILGASTYDNGQTDEGRVYLYHGSAPGMSTTAAWVVESNQISAGLGFYVDAAGDVDRDGFSDVVVGAWLYDNGQTNEGRVYVYHGSAAGLSTTAAWAAEPDSTGASFGQTVAGVRDLNGDGYADVAVGMPSFTNGANRGEVRVYHGSAGGLSTTAAWTFEPGVGLSWFSGTNSGGRALASGGDLDRDGYSDLLIGAYAYANGEAGEGRVWVFHGSVTGLQAVPARVFEPNVASTQFGISVASGDVNGDGFSDAIVGSATWTNGQSGEGRAFIYHGGTVGISTTAVWSTESHQVDGDYGWYVGSGDVNADGFSDVLVGADAYDNGETDEGRVYLYHGSASGVSTTAAWTYEADQATAYEGTVAAAGDLNRDGFADVLTTAFSYDNGQANEGRAWVHHGDGLRPEARGERARPSSNELGKLFATAGCFLTAARR